MFSNAVGSVEVSSRPTRIGKPNAKSSGPLMMTASVTLSSLPNVGADGLVDVPEAECRLCEVAIEVTANIVSALTRTARSLSSPMPPVAFMAESDVERAWLARASAIRYSTRSIVSGLPAPLEPSADVIEGLRDRLDGVQAVATYLGQSTPLGRYREAVRFFEIAFRLPANDLEKKLARLPKV